MKTKTRRAMSFRFALTRRAPFLRTHRHSLVPIPTLALAQESSLTLFLVHWNSDQILAIFAVVPCPFLNKSLRPH